MAIFQYFSLSLRVENEWKKYTGDGVFSYRKLSAPPSYHFYVKIEKSTSKHYWEFISAVACGLIKCQIIFSIFTDMLTVLNDITLCSFMNGYMGCKQWNCRRHSNNNTVISLAHSCDAYRLTYLSFSILHLHTFH